MGKAILYPVDSLRAWLLRQAQEKTPLPDESGQSHEGDEKKS
jgi:hypothetical protein